MAEVTEPWFLPTYNILYRDYIYEKCASSPLSAESNRSTLIVDYYCRSTY